MIRLPSLRRLGLEELAGDHIDSLTWIDKDDRRHTSIADLVVFFLVPAGIAAGVWLVGGELKSTSDMLDGVAIITGLLLGLLVHVLGLGLRVAEDPRLTRSSKVAVLVDELRANTAWAAAVGVGLTSALVLVGAFTGEQEAGSGYPAWLSGLLVGTFVHLMLTLLMILKRVRATYKALGK